jgi:hypothetical protein
MTERNWIALPRRLAAVGAIALTLVLTPAMPASARAPVTTQWVCLVPQADGSVTRVVFVSAPEAARHGITQANATAGGTFMENFGETCTVG